VLPCHDDAAIASVAAVKQADLLLFEENPRDANECTRSECGGVRVRSVLVWSAQYGSISGSLTLIPVLVCGQTVLAGLAEDAVLIAI
jgi:hypothetical protein